MLVRNPQVEEAPLQHELMLFEPTSAKFYVLNGTMAFVWRNCTGERTAADIAAELVEAFDGVDAQQALADVKGAVQELQTLGLISSSEPVSA